MKHSKALQKLPVKARERVQKRLHEISSLIQHKREMKGLTQEELAEELGLSSMTISFIEQGRRYPSLAMLFIICDYLKIEVKFL